ncbi:MAG: hypothetical protein RL609_113 [Bacteroidota bacterium]
MSYPEVLEFLFAQLPMFHRVGAAAYKPSLKNTEALCQWLDYPERKIKTIHVGGTNGKGSTSHLIASALQCAGYKVGLYTSPHLIDFRERIKINGQWITESAVIDFVESYKDSHCIQIQPSFFELTFAMAMQYFAQEKVDVAIVEVGMGGRLDSTNVITPLLSVITNVSKDHMQFLGNTIEAIATEKAGIIKEHVPVVLGIMKENAKSVFESTAKQRNSHFISCTPDEPVPDCALKGEYQQENSRTAFKALENLKSSFPKLTPEKISEGFLQVQELTGFRGRWEIIQKTNPTIIADVGHNEDGVQWVIQQVKKEKFLRLHIVLGMVNDKDVDHILGLFPKHARYYFCKANIPRGLDAEILREKSAVHHLIGDVYPSVQEAFMAAKKEADHQDLILVTGSFFTVAEILN